MTVDGPASQSEGHRADYLRAPKDVMRDQLLLDEGLYRHLLYASARLGSLIAADVALHAFGRLCVLYSNSTDADNKSKDNLYKDKAYDHDRVFSVIKTTLGNESITHDDQRNRKTITSADIVLGKNGLKRGFPRLYVEALRMCSMRLEPDQPVPLTLDFNPMARARPLRHESDPHPELAPPDAVRQLTQLVTKFL
jgi:hypothetical protein